MRLFLFICLVVSLVGCNELSQSTRQSFDSDDEIVSQEILANNSGDGDFGFKMKLPEGFDLLDGKPVPADQIPPLSESPYIKFECSSSVKSTIATQINVGLKNISTGKNYVARFQYVCPEGAGLRLVNLVSGEKYQLSIHVMNASGVIFQGISGIFTTASKKIVIKLKRVQKNDSIDVEIVFPTEPEPVAASKITCLFEKSPAAVKMPAPADDAGNLENDIVAPPGPGGNCSVTSVGIVPLPLPAVPVDNGEVPVSSAQACATSGVSCSINLGVLKSVAVFRVSVSSKDCPNDGVMFRYVTLHPGQSAKVNACDVRITPQPPKPAEFCNDKTMPLELKIILALERGKLKAKYKTVHCGVLYIGDHLSPGIGGYVANVTRICHSELGAQSPSTWITGATSAITSELKALATKDDYSVVCVVTNKDAPPSIEGSALPIEEIKLVKGGNGTGSGIDSTDVDCSVNPVFDADATLKTPLNVAYGIGDMDRRKIDGANKGILSNFVNPFCGSKYDPAALNGVRNPSTSSDKATRDMVCRLHGYAAATSDNSFGYYQYASPSNNVAAHFDAVAKAYVTVVANQSPADNKILIWTSCKGKLYNACKEKIVSEGLNCK